MSNLSNAFDRIGLRARYEPTPKPAAGSGDSLVEKIAEAEASLGIVPEAPAPEPKPKPEPEPEAPPVVHGKMTVRGNVEAGDLVVTGEPRDSIHGR